MLKQFLRPFSLSYESYNKHIVVQSKRFAGHSKWANIRHIKGAKDAERSRLFTKLGRQIKVAVQEGGSVDPKKNLQLNQVIEQTRRANMPAATVQSILKSCESSKSQDKSYMLEIKGPGSCFILCEVYTSQLHGLKMILSTILKKHQSRFSDGGGLHLFEEKGQIEAEHQALAGKPEEEILEKATDHAIESGAEDVKVIENSLVQFSCGKSNLNQVVGELEKMGYKVTSAEVEYVPFNLQPLQDSELEVCQKLFDKLESVPEVVRLVDNIA
ncbi:translational activator of cytochrome c oxidase 1 [Diabrotica virgifera virgifera]|uniref:Translational activator of cytochrome c oxidase 1 n=1 Tax=Diabrotica virgifera virgifera TaxID=50390 RepID=A0A6P7FB93_DIAVI|nr:translational activator of cytochrome c oxidase 1 [Diabrotica virgifera virgifera]